MKRKSLSLAVLAFALVGILAVAGLAVGDAAASGSSVDPALIQALRFAPPVSGSVPYEIGFIDLARIESGGSFRLSANATAAQVAAFLKRVSDAGAQSIEPATTLFPFAAVRWEATFFSAGAPLDVASLHPGPALRRITDRLGSCGFKSSRDSSFAIYAGSLPQVFKCAGPSGIGMVGINSVYAVDASGGIVVMSTSPSAVRAAIGGGELSPGSSPLADVLGPLSADPALTVDLGTNYCKRLTHAVAGPHATADATRAALRADPAGASYMAFGLGYRVTTQPPTAQIVMAYEDAKTASAQLSVRERLLKADYSFVVRSPYSKYLAIESAAVQGDNVVLTVKPANGNLLALGQMAAQSDLAFARC